jgi:hypothetical protein
VFETSCHDNLWIACESNLFHKFLINTLVDNVKKMNFNHWDPVTCESSRAFSRRSKSFSSDSLKPGISACVRRKNSGGKETAAIYTHRFPFPPDGGRHFLCLLQRNTTNMNWSEKAKEIAESVCTEQALDNERIGDISDKSAIRKAIMPIAMKAALMGMAFECDNWVLKRKNDRHNGKDLHRD